MAFQKAHHSSNPHLSGKTLVKEYPPRIFSEQTDSDIDTESELGRTSTSDMEGERITKDQEVFMDQGDNEGALPCGFTQVQKGKGKSKGKRNRTELESSQGQENITKNRSESNTNPDTGLTVYIKGVNCNIVNNIAYKKS